MVGTANDLNISESGIVTFDGTSIFHGRTLTAGTGIFIANGSGVSGNPTISLAGGGVALQHLTGNTGGALNPDGSNNINIITANSTVKFAGSGNTLTQDFNISNLVLGSSLPAVTTGVNSTGLGLSALSNLTSGEQSTAIGYSSMSDYTTGVSSTAVGYYSMKGSTGSFNVALGATTLNNGTGASNVAIGYLAMGQGTGAYASNVGVGNAALNKLTSATFNNGIGSESLNALTSGARNQGLGYRSLYSITTGTDNIAIGNLAGSANTTSDSSNIYLNNIGSAAENNTIRIGTQGTSAGQQNQCYLAGVLNTVSGRVVNITTPGAYPYTTLITDYVILVDTSAARTITPLASPVTGTTYRIKDNVGSAATNNITITPSGKNIDGAASTVINVAYGSVDIVYNGIQWNIL